MPKVVALYRYPVKGFTAETCDTLHVLNTGRIVGDRVLGFRFADSTASDDAWSKKHEMLALVNTPGLARLRCQFNHYALRLRLYLDGDLLVEADLKNEADRQHLAAILEKYVLELDENPLNLYSERLPLKLVGDGITPRFHDNERGMVTLHSRSSLAAVADVIGALDFSELRFRSNLVVDSLSAWEEQNWIGHKVQIGDICFEVVESKTRCLATHVNPQTGERDLPVLTTLKHHFEQKKPTFAIAMLTDGLGGQIHVGDTLRLV